MKMELAKAHTVTAEPLGNSGDWVVTVDRVQILAAYYYNNRSWAISDSRGTAYNNTYFDGIMELLLWLSRLPDNELQEVLNYGSR